MNSNSTRLPVGGRSQSSPRCVPRKRLAGRHQIALGDLLVDLHGGVRKAAQQRAVERLESARGPLCTRNGPALGSVVVHELRVEHLVGECQVVLVLAAPDELRHDPLVVVGVHLDVTTLPSVTAREGSAARNPGPSAWRGPAGLMRPRVPRGVGRASELVTARPTDERGSARPASRGLSTRRPAVHARTHRQVGPLTELAPTRGTQGRQAAGLQVSAHQSGSSITLRATGN